MTRAGGCQRKVGARGEHWWICLRCHHTWNDRNTGPHWRPVECPERIGHDDEKLLNETTARAIAALEDTTP